MTSKGEKGILTLYSDVQATSVRWLWYPFIAVGKITLLQGDPGDGKSTMMMNLIAELLRSILRHCICLNGIGNEAMVFYLQNAKISECV